MQNHKDRHCQIKLLFTDFMMKQDHSQHGPKGTTEEGPKKQGLFLDSPFLFDGFSLVNAKHKKCNQADTGKVTRQDHCYFCIQGLLFPFYCFELYMAVAGWSNSSDELHL